MQEYCRRQRAANPEGARETRRQYRSRPDRPCRYAKSGCSEFAEVGLLCCRKHQRADAKRHLERKRADLTGKLAVAQDWICPWCSKPLPEDLADVHIDHIIPKASGVVIEAEWNLQVLHQRCNRVKFAKITPQALALAAAHGINLTHTRAA